MNAVALDRLRNDPIKLPRVLSERILMLLMLLATYVSSQASQVQAQKLTAHDVAQLGLGLSSQHELQQPQQEYPGLPMMDQIMSDEYMSDFGLTEQTIGLLGSSLEEFVRVKQVAGKQRSDNPLINHFAIEFEYIHGSFWGQFQPLIQYIIQERPNNLGNMDLAFRCERYQELELLKGLAQTSSIYSLIVDTFSIELYTHCLKRKLAMVKLHQVRPSSILRQFVDIYLDLPVDKQARRELRKQMIDSIDSGLAYKLSAANLLERHGRPESVANLVLDTESSFQLGAEAQDDRLVGKFKLDCEQHTSQIGLIWMSFDQLANFLSSASNNLANFNDGIKLVAPQLMYAATCGHLIRLADGG